MRCVDVDVVRLQHADVMKKNNMKIAREKKSIVRPPIRGLGRSLLFDWHPAWKKDGCFTLMSVFLADRILEHALTFPGIDGARSGPTLDPRLMSRHGRSALLALSHACASRPVHFSRTTRLAKHMLSELRKQTEPACWC